MTRKPCAESSTTGNVLKHSCGALHVEACRVVSNSPPKPTTAPGWDSVNSKNAEAGYRPGAYQQGGATYLPSDGGRWPSNVVLTHRPGCVRAGTVSVKSAGHYPAARPSGSHVSGPAGHKGQSDLVERHTKGELVDVWDCQPGCPVAAMDAQSGVLTSGIGAVKRLSSRDAEGNRGAAYGAESRREGEPMISYGDTGGASRFFRQVRS